MRFLGPFDKWFKSTPFHGVVTGSNPIGGIFPNKGGNFHDNYIKIIDDVIIWNVTPPNKVMDVPL